MPENDPPSFSVRQLVEKFLAADAEKLDDFSASFLLSVAELAKEEQKDVSIPQVENALAAFDIAANWFSSVAMGFWLLTVRIDAKDSARFNAWRAHLALSGCIVSQLIAVRKLVVEGLDIPAKQVARSIVEYSDVAILLSIDESLVENFVKSQEIEDQNAFWYKYVSKGKARRAYYRKLVEVVGEKVAQDHIEFRKQEDTVLSVSAHPSFVASLMSLVAGLGVPTVEESTMPAFFGSKSRFHSRTLMYLVHCLVDYAAIGKKPDMAVVENDDEFTFFTKKNIDMGEKLTIGVTIYSMRDGRPLFYPRSDVSADNGAEWQESV